MNRSETKTWNPRMELDRDSWSLQATRSSNSITATSWRLDWIDDPSIRGLSSLGSCKSSSQPFDSALWLLYASSPPNSREDAYHNRLLDPCLLLILSENEEKARFGYLWALSIGQTSSIFGNDPLNPWLHELERLDSEQHFRDWVSEPIADYSCMVHWTICLCFAWANRGTIPIQELWREFWEL